MMHEHDRWLHQYRAMEAEQMNALKEAHAELERRMAHDLHGIGVAASGRLVRPGWKPMPTSVDLAPYVISAILAGLLNLACWLTLYGPNAPHLAGWVLASSLLTVPMRWAMHKMGWLPE